jgi:peptidoglycan/LPS O-acetylase OafA/YrhL
MGGGGTQAPQHWLRSLAKLSCRRYAQLAPAAHRCSSASAELSQNDLRTATERTPLLWNESCWTIVLFPFGALIVYLAGLHGHFVRRFFATPFVSIAGGMCYSVYLTHGSILAMVATALARAHIAALPVTLQLLVVVGTSLLAAFLVGTAFFLVIERPCMDPLWPRKVLATLRRRYDRWVVS